MCVARSAVFFVDLAGVEPVASGVLVGDDEVCGFGVAELNSGVVCIGEGVDSGVLVALLEEMPGVCSATRGV